MKKSKLGAYLTLAPELLGLLTSAGTALAQDVKQEEILSQLEGKPPFVYPINEIPAPGDPYRIGKIQEAIQQEQEPIIAVDPEYAPEGSGNQARKEDKFVQFGAGFSACPIGPKREKLQYAKTSVMFPVLDLFEGDMQLLLELMGYSITNGYGKYFAGLGLEGRHYFAEKDSIVIPYFQLGAGVLLNDAYKEYKANKKRDIGGLVEFKLSVDIGAEIPVNLKLFERNLKISVVPKIGVVHISNAGIYPDNLGINFIEGGIYVIVYF